MDDFEPIELQELERLALAADPDAEIPSDARPFVADGVDGIDLLPGWYMPAPQNLKRTPARRFAAVTFIVALLALNGAGLCVTYGLPEIAW